MTNFKTIIFITSVVMSTAQFHVSAQETSVDAVIVSSPTANIRQQPSTSAAIAGKAFYNDCFEMLGQEGDWYKIRNPFTSEEAWISSSVAGEGSFLMEYTPLYTSFKESDTSYSVTECKGRGSNEKCYTTTWNLTYPSGSFVGPVIVCMTETAADASGRVHSNESYFKGVCTPANILITESCDMDGNSPEKLERPFIISHVIGMDEEGIVSKGIVYNFAEY